MNKVGSQIKKRLTYLFFLFAPIYFLAQPTWTSRANYQGFACDDGVGFSVNGFGYCGTGATSSSLTNTFYKFDDATNTWTNIANFPGSKRQYCAAFVIGTKAYVFGGLDEFGVFKNDLYEYDAVANTWTAKASLPSLGRSGSVGFTLNGNGYIATGLLSTGVHTDEVWMYDPIVNGWLQRANYSGGVRKRSFAFTFNNLAYVGAGQDSGGKLYNDFWEYDPIANSWTQKTNFPGTKRYYAVGFSNNFYGFAGIGLDTANNYKRDLYKYDVVSNSWSALPDLPGFSRKGSASFVINNAGFIVNGIDSVNTRTDQCWRLSNVVGIKEYEEKISVNIFPNPFSDVLNVSVDLASEKTIELFDILGNCIFKSPIKNKNAIDLKFLSNGIYFVCVKGKETILARRKIVKE